MISMERTSVHRLGAPYSGAFACDIGARCSSGVELPTVRCGADGMPRLRHTVSTLRREDCTATPRRTMYRRQSRSARLFMPLRRQRRLGRRLRFAPPPAAPRLPTLARCAAHRVGLASRHYMCHVKPCALRAHLRQGALTLHIKPLRSHAARTADLTCGIYSGLTAGPPSRWSPFGGAALRSIRGGHGRRRRASLASPVGTLRAPPCRPIFWLRPPLMARTARRGSRNYHLLFWHTVAIASPLSPPRPSFPAGEKRGAPGFARLRGAQS